MSGCDGHSCERLAGLIIHMWGEIMGKTISFVSSKIEG